MPQILGYGEDALTYWALTQRLQNILTQLKDTTDPDKALVIYRPSFGRKGKSKGKDDSKPRGPQFGEFDGIIATSHAIYLIEAKWNKSSKRKNEEYRVEKRQRWRHQIMREYVKTWRQKSTDVTSWKEYRQSQPDGRFSIINKENEQTNQYLLPNKKDKLAKNLEFVLNKLKDYGQDIFDVLL